MKMKKLMSLVLCMMLSLFALPLLTVVRTDAAETDEPAAAETEAADALPAASESWDAAQTVTVRIGDETRTLDLRSYLIGVMAAEMESAALLTLAKKYNARALGMLTVSDSIVAKEPEMTALEREQSLRDMITIALETVCEFI